jgi:hypothetical protein
MQERLILRYQTAAARTADWSATPKAGQVTYNDETKTLEMWRATPGAWVRSLMFQFLTSNKDDAAGVSIYHTASGAKGIQFTPNSLLIDAPTTNWLNGVGVLDSTGLALKVGAQTAKLATDADGLTVDKIVKSPGVQTDVMTVTGGIAAGSVAAPSMTITSTLTLTGATVSGGTLNSTSGTIGGVTLATGQVGAGQGAAGGMQSGQGHFYGDANSAVMRQRANAGAAWGAAYLQVTANDITAGPGGASGSFYMNEFLRIMAGRGIAWHNAGGTHQAWISPVIYSGSDPGAGNFPDGTIWLS